VSGAVCGLLPARHAARVNVVDTLRQQARGHSTAPSRRFRQLLVVAEVAVAVTVIAAAGLMWRSFIGLQRTPLGFDANHVVKLRTSLRGEDFRAATSRLRFFETLQRQLGALPGIGSVSAISYEPPIQPGVGASRLSIPGVASDDATPLNAMPRVVMPRYFETMRIPIVRGRGIDARDQADSAQVAAISESMARRYFPGVDPIGRSFVASGQATPMQIVGVVGDVATAGMDPAPLPTFYVAYSQHPMNVMTVVMSVPHGDLATSAREAERTAWAQSRSTNVYAVETMTQYLAVRNWRARVGALLLGAFALLGLFLATAGLYAIVSYTVTQRRAEIGLRLALGARPGTIVAMVLGDGLRLVAAGVVVGAAASLALSRGLAGLLYGVAPNDPATLAAVSVLLLAVAACACVGPALRASRVDPHTAMREVN